LAQLPFVIKRAGASHGVVMISSDDHEGLKAALRATFNGVPWNRCHVHLQPYIPHPKTVNAEQFK
jgi:hypothetical protein